MNILVFNAGSASLKFEVIATPGSPKASDELRKLVSRIVEGIAEEATFSLLVRKEILVKKQRHTVWFWLVVGGATVLLAFLSYSATFRNFSLGVPQICSTTSGVYRAK